MAFCTHFQMANILALYPVFETQGLRHKFWAILVLFHKSGQNESTTRANKRQEKVGFGLETVYFDTRERFVQWKLDDTLYRMIRTLDKRYDRIAVVCIGTDRSTGDSYGPLTGHLLSRMPQSGFHLFGTFEKPVHALTLPEALKQIDTKHTLVIAVDASVGAASYVGYIGMSQAPVRPGSGLGKDLPPVGDVSITGIAAESGLAPFLMLQNASLGMVYSMAEKTFRALHMTLSRLRRESVESGTGLERLA